MKKGTFITKAIALITLAFLSSCRKDEPVPPAKYTSLFLPQAVKDYMYFEPGTWWVYEEETSGMLDSVYVYYAAQGLDSVYEEGRLTHVYEWFNVYTTSSFDGYNYKYRVHTSWSVQNGRFLVFRSKTKPGDFVGETIAFYYLPVIGQEVYPGNYLQSSVKPTTKYDSLNVLGSYYYQVYDFYERQNITEDGQETVFSFGAKAGIVKKQLLDSTKVWNLRKGSILQ